MDKTRHATTNYRALMKRDDLKPVYWNDFWGDPVYKIYIRGQRFFFSLNHKKKTARPLRYEGHCDFVVSYYVWNWKKLTIADEFLHEYLYGDSDVELYVDALGFLEVIK